MEKIKEKINSALGALSKKALKELPGDGDSDRFVFCCIAIGDLIQKKVFNFLLSKMVDVDFSIIENEVFNCFNAGKSVQIIITASELGTEVRSEATFEQKNPSFKIRGKFFKIVNDFEKRSSLLVKQDRLRI
ncbi:MAG: hypothetical protein V1698_03065 [bacterium]